jgi:hypothetical protein
MENTGKPSKFEKYYYYRFTSGSILTYLLVLGFIDTFLIISIIQRIQIINLIVMVIFSLIILYFSWMLYLCVSKNLGLYFAQDGIYLQKGNSTKYSYVEFSKITGLFFHEDRENSTLEILAGDKKFYIFRSWFWRESPSFDEIRSELWKYHPDIIQKK